MISRTLGREALSIKSRYEHKLLNNLLLIGGVFLLLLILSLISLKVGIASISLKQTGQMLIELFFQDGLKDLDRDKKILLFLRLPRVVLAILTGAALSASGVVMQGITRNPLVSPFTIGISSAAAFGASVAMVFGFSILPGSIGGVVFNAFCFSLICAAIVYLISWRLGMAPETLILTGIAMNYLFSAMTAVVKYVAEEHQLSALVNWTFGSLNSATWKQNLSLACLLLIALPLVYRFSLSLNVLTGGGDDLAKTLGINPVAVKITTGLIAVLLTAGCISFTGVIGFVGLGGPHVARLIIGGDHRYLIPFSVLTGSILVVLSDTIGRTILSPVIIPVGIVISFLGVPLFLSLIITKRRKYYK